MPRFSAHNLLYCAGLFFVGSNIFAAPPDRVSAASPYSGSHSSAQAITPGGPNSEFFNKWRDELGLSVEQQGVIAEILADYGQRLRPLFQRGAETVWSIMNVAPINPEYTVDTEAAAQAAAETAADIVRIASEMRSAVHSVMTAEQIATLDRLIEESRSAWRERAAQHAKGKHGQGKMNKDSATED